VVAVISEDDLTQSNYVTAIVRLRLDGKGRVLNGEVLDLVTGKPVRFSGWQGLVSVLSSVLAAFGVREEDKWPS
jgi:hypothetical protein